MTLPVVFTRVWVAGTFRDLRTGAAIVGRHLHAVPRARSFTDLRGRGTVLAPSRVAELTDATGFVAVALEAIWDDPDLSPTGVLWDITDPLRRTYPLQVSTSTPVWRAPPRPPGADPHPLDGLPVIWLSDVIPAAERDGGPAVQFTAGPPGHDGHDGHDGQDGRDGDPGPPGPPRASAEWSTEVPAQVWVIDHDLGYRPAAVVLTDPTGLTQLEAEITERTATRVVVTFPYGVALPGRALLS